jgi:hypothetical protein
MELEYILFLLGFMRGTVFTVGSDEVFLDVFHLRLETCPYERTSQIFFLTILTHKFQEKSVTFQIVIYEFDENIIVFFYHKDQINYTVFRDIKKCRIQLVILFRIAELCWPEFTKSIIGELSSS